MKKHKYYCSCNKGEKMKGTTRNKHTKMNPTTVTGDSVCVYCEHYAIASLYRPKYDASPFVVDDEQLMAVRAKKRSDHISTTSRYTC